MLDERLHELIGDIYAAAVDPDVAHDALRKMCALLGSPNGSIGFWNSQTTDYQNIQHGNMLDAAERAQYLELLPTDPGYLRRQVLPEGKAVLGESMTPLSEYRRLEVFRFYRRVECVHLLAMPMFRRTDLFADVSVYRPESAEPHGARELGIANLLIPHLQRSVGMARQLHGIGGKVRQLESALSRLATACLTVDSDGNLLFANPEGEAVLSQNRPLRVIRGRVVADTVGNRGKWQTLLGRLSQPHAQGTAVALNSEQGPLPLLAVPLAPVRAEVLGLPLPSPSLGLVILARSGRTPKTTTALLQQLYGLTPAEAEIAAALFNGETLQECADRRCRSLSTAKSHLKSIFAKTGTRRQADLVRLMGALSVLRTEHQR